MRRGVWTRVARLRMLFLEALDVERGAEEGFGGTGVVIVPEALTLEGEKDLARRAGKHAEGDEDCHLRCRQQRTVRREWRPILAEAAARCLVRKHGERRGTNQPEGPQGRRDQPEAKAADARPAREEEVADREHDDLHVVEPREGRERDAVHALAYAYDLVECQRDLELAL